MKAVEELSAVIGVAPACDVLGVPRAAFYRKRKPDLHPPHPARPRPARALSAEERATVLEVMHSPRFVDMAPAEVYATLLDEGTYFCSVRTMYRLLDEHHELRERRDQLRHPVYRKPELLACAPNQVWSWDITKLLGPAKWSYFHLYVILDIFSRCVVGWLLAHRECASLARRLIRETVDRQGADPHSLTIHSDRGPAMKSHSVAQLLATLGITKSHTRPHCSNDNPFSESHFKTLKYQPHFPDRFDSYEHALDFCRRFFPWYNHEHYHWGLGLLTPASVHYGHAQTIQAQRQALLDAAYARHPERFPKGRPSPLPLPTQVWINPPRANTQRPADVQTHPVCDANPTSSTPDPESDLLRSLITHDLDPPRLLTPPFSIPVRPPGNPRIRDEQPVSQRNPMPYNTPSATLNS